MTKKFERRVSKLAKKYGCDVGRRGNGHLMIITSDGHKLTTAASPTNPDISLKNIERDLRKYA